MKKLLNLTLILSISILLSLGFSMACETVSLDDWSVCIDINKNNNSYTLDTDINCNSSSTCSLSCNILLPDNTLKNVGACNGTFQWNNRDTKKIKVYVDLNNKYGTIEKFYDFNIWERWNSSSSSNSNYDLDNFYLSINDAVPSTNQRVDLTVKARDRNNSTVNNYNGNIGFKVYYRTSSSSSWVLTTSSSYFEMKSTYNNWYSFSSSYNGQRTLTDFIRFKKSYDYKVMVYDKNNTSIYKEITFNVGGSSSSNSNINWFTNKETEILERINKVWSKLMTQLKIENSRLKYNNNRQNMSDQLYNNVKDVLNNKTNKKFRNYSEFFNDFEKWYSYTINIIH